MNTEIIINQSIDSRFTLRVLKSDIGYHYELMDCGKLGFGTYFLYGQTVHKSALCLGGAIYAIYHDDELAEDAMKVIEDNGHLLGGCELKR